MRIERNKVLIQIGTYNGADEFNSIAKYALPSLVILVEPNKDMNGFIRENYRNVPNVIIENVVITDVSKGVVNLYHPDNDPEAPFYNECFSLLPMDDWGDKLKKFKVQSMSFNDLCKKYKVNHIHYLQIDTEGYDTEIIKSIDFKKINIDIIKYENWPYSEDCYKRYGEKAKLYGINGMRYVNWLLESMGYIIVEETADIIAVKNSLE